MDYAASKGAIDAFTVGLAKEVALEGIRRPARAGTPDGADGAHASAGSALEVAQAIVWLLSTESSYTTGSLLDVTGGR